MDTERTLSVDIVAELNQLVEINHDRTCEYRQALGVTRDPKLKSVFERYLNQSIQFTNSLTTWLRSYGVDSDSRNQRLSGYEKVVIKLRSFLPKPQREEILQACEYREAISMSIYKKILSFKRLPYEACLEVKRQQEHIEKAFCELIGLSSSNELIFS